MRCPQHFRTVPNASCPRWNLCCPRCGFLGRLVPCCTMTCSIEYFWAWEIIRSSHQFPFFLIVFHRWGFMTVVRSPPAQPGPWLLPSTETRPPWLRWEKQQPHGRKPWNILCLDKFGIPVLFWHGEVHMKFGIWIDMDWYGLHMANIWLILANAQ
jgi:hypothetical protein